MKTAIATRTGPNVAGTRYPMADKLTVDLPVQEWRNWEVEATGEYREPKQGEWYLSGAVIEGYRSRGDLLSKYWIARPVTKRTTQEVAIQIGKDVARGAFGLRGNRSEIHLSEAELAALVAHGVMKAVKS